MKKEIKRLRSKLCTNGDSCSHCRALQIQIEMTEIALRHNYLE